MGVQGTMSIKASFLLKLQGLGLWWQNRVPPVGKHAVTARHLPSCAVHAGADTKAAACED